MGSEGDAGGPGSAGPAAGDTIGLQFDRVEPSSPEADRTCKGCQRRIDDEYFEIRGNVVCRACAEIARGGSGSGGAAFLRALLFGGGAALAGTIVWFAILKLTSYEFGLLAIAVGLMVGVAVRKGSRGRGGAKYQILAMALTYASITSSNVPLVVKELSKLAADASKPPASAAEGSAAPVAAGGAEGGAVAPASPKQPAEPHHLPTALALLLFVVLVFGLAFVAPFMAGLSNIMGIIIIGIALYEAWKINKRVPVQGPFRIVTAPP